MTNAEVRAALARCGLTNEHITSQMRVLSGGENAKVRLCKLMQNKYNVLVLDEPTNHLDVYAKEELSRALRDFKGTIVLVSHEPEFYQGWVTDIWNIEDFSRNSSGSLSLHTNLSFLNGSSTKVSAFNKCVDQNNAKRQ